MSRTIMVIHPGSLGDVLLAVPAMVRLRACFPSHSMVLCAGDQVARLLLACHVIDAWVSVHGRDGADLFVGTEMVTGPVRTWLEHCDLAIGWIEDLDGRLSGRLKAFGIREVIVRSPFSATIRATHQRDRFLETIDEPPAEDEDAVLSAAAGPLITLGLACLNAAGLSVEAPLVIIHPGSGSAYKCVRAEFLVPVMTALQLSGAIPVVLEGPADRNPVERVLQLCIKPPIVLKGFDLLTVAGVLAQGRLFIGQDSGITHLAGLMRVQTVAVFGPTNPARWAPCGTHVTVVQGASCRCRSWDEVSRCEEQPCLDISQDHFVALCLARLRERDPVENPVKPPCH